MRDRFISIKKEWLWFSSGQSYCYFINPLRNSLIFIVTNNDTLHFEKQVTWYCLAFTTFTTFTYKIRQRILFHFLVKSHYCVTYYSLTGEMWTLGSGQWTWARTRTPLWTNANPRNVSTIRKKGILCAVFKRVWPIHKVLVLID